MKASELIEKLAELKAKHGDLPVYCMGIFMCEPEADEAESVTCSHMGHFFIE